MIRFAFYRLIERVGGSDIESKPLERSGLKKT